VELEGWVLETPWDAVARNAEQITRDVGMIHPHAGSYLPAGVSRIGKGAIYTGHAVELEEGVVLDVRDGPIHLSDRVTIQAPARIVGPAFLGPDSVVFGGPLTHVSVGPVCKLRGEIEASVFLGYDNKAHDGYLGHAYLGRWVNLGALTTNSDLKNNYSPVRIAGPYEQRDTGVLKLGVFLGDHAKTGIGTMLTGGTVMGAGSNVFGGTVPKWVPPFSWGRGEALDVHRRRDFLETATRVLPRRDVEPTEDVREWLAAAWDEARG
jgi:UDP-N-acetylglucosamine diphosphorylase/glucosamine-1-phosphate N-acetyltransferase